MEVRQADVKLKQAEADLELSKKDTPDCQKLADAAASCKAIEENLKAEDEAKKEEEKTKE